MNTIRRILSKELNKSLSSTKLVPTFEWQRASNLCGTQRVKGQRCARNQLVLNNMGIVIYLFFALIRINSQRVQCYVHKIYS